MKFLAPLALAAMMALPAAATDLEEMTDAERDAFRAEVRAYLLDNPEVLMEAIAILDERQAAAEADRDLQLVTAYADQLFSSPYDFVTGNPEGDITIVEFIDYRCGYCRRAAPEVAGLMEADENIRLVIKEFPILGEQSMLAARFALSARIVEGDQAYDDMHNALIVMQGDMTETSLARLANTLGYDGEAIIDGLDAPEIDEVIGANYQLAQAMGISGTPTFVIGDQLIRGFVPGAQMSEIVDNLRAEDG